MALVLHTSVTDRIVWNVITDYFANVSYWLYTTNPSNLFLTTLTVRYGRAPVDEDSSEGIYTLYGIAISGWGKSWSTRSSRWTNFIHASLRCARNSIRSSSRSSLTPLSEKACWFRSLLGLYARVTK